MNIIDNDHLLTQQQHDLLQQCAKANGFRLGRYSSLDGILTKLKVDVIIKPGIETRTVPEEYFKAALDYWRNVANNLDEDESLRDDYRSAMNNIEEIQSEMHNWGDMRLRGYYIANAITLFPDEMANEYYGTRMDELLVSTLAHEAMHAYFNRPRHRGREFPYVPFVEEPLAEFGMLLFLYETQSPYYVWAKQDVGSKNTCYRYGANLMDQCLNEGAQSPTRQYLEDYKIKLDIYAMPNRRNGSISMPPKASGSAITINGKLITPRWKEIRIFFGRKTETLGLDGDWGLFLEMRMDFDCMYDVKHLYIGDNFHVRDASSFFHHLPHRTANMTSFDVAKGNKKYDSRGNCNAIIETATNALVLGCRSTVIPNSVTSIGESAFDGCSGLTSITIPDSVTKIGNNAFRRCNGLTSIDVANGNKKYDSRGNCNAIIETASNALVLGCRSTVIPNSVTSIGDYAFDGCSGLTSVTIPDSVSSIGDYAFDGCSSLTSITIPNSVTSIGNYAFNGCDALKSVTIPDSVSSIGDYAFDGCSSLTSITIPNSVTKIAERAFLGCTGLTSVTIPNSVTTIGGYAFSGCRSLTSVTIPNSVTSIGCLALHNTAWFDNQPDGLVYAGLVAYSYKGTMPNGTSVVIKDGTLGIAGSCFSDCSALTSVTIPNSVTEIGDYAFFGCDALTEIRVPKGSKKHFVSLFPKRLCDKIIEV